MICYKCNYMETHSKFFNCTICRYVLIAHKYTMLFFVSEKNVDI